MSRAEPYLVPYVRMQDVHIVIHRIPEENRLRLRDVFLSSHHHGLRWLGSVRRLGRRDIDLFSILPPRISMRPFIHKGISAAEFGAPKSGQWPPWPVQRFLLYDVLLHELGHLQIIHPQKSRWERKFASEASAREFAIHWRRTLWSEEFNHPDPVHNPPRDDELETSSLWERLDKAQRFHLVELVLKSPHEMLPNLSFLGQLTEMQHGFLIRALCHRVIDQLPPTS